MSTNNSWQDLPRVILRDVRESDHGFLSELASPEVGGEWDTFDDSSDQFLNGEDFGGSKQIAELEDGTRVGSVSWIQVPFGPNVRSLAWSIGITIHPDFRRRYLGSSAQRTLAKQLFAGSEANRVQADTDPNNIPEQRALMRAGFTEEGVARQAQWRRGHWHDRIVFSLLRQDLLS
jgi:RimJ/RimL family protein N-acetyltransferase